MLRELLLVGLLYIIGAALGLGYIWLVVKVVCAASGVCA